MTEDDLTLAEVGKGLIEELRELNQSVRQALEPPQVEPTPPRCPHCGSVNPTVRIEPPDEPVEGPLIEMVGQAMCTRCKQYFYILNTGWAIFKTAQAAMANGQILVERMMGNVNSKHAKPA